MKTVLAVIPKRRLTSLPEVRRARTKLIVSNLGPWFIQWFICLVGVLAEYQAFLLIANNYSFSLVSLLPTLNFIPLPVIILILIATPYAMLLVVILPREEGRVVMGIIGLVVLLVSVWVISLWYFLVFVSTLNTVVQFILPSLGKSGGLPLFLLINIVFVQIFSFAHAQWREIKSAYVRFRKGVVVKAKGQYHKVSSINDGIFICEDCEEAFHADSSYLPDTSDVEALNRGESCQGKGTRTPT